jgi:DNA-binding transcriptional LysR family regulator
MPELKHLRVLRAVAEAGSFSAAADALDYTQPAVSKMVAALEREVGATLIDRGTRPLRRTDAGEALASRAAAALEQLAVAQLEVEAVGRLDRGRVNVATFSSAGSSLVVVALRAMRDEHPGVEVAIAERSMPSAAIAALRECEHDLVVTFDYPAPARTSARGSRCTRCWTTRWTSATRRGCSPTSARRARATG